MSEHDDLEARLRALGSDPVDPAVQSRHLTAMASVHWRRSRLGRAKVVAAFAAGLVLGGTGLASAGALGPVQDPVADAAAKVGVNLPGGTERVNATNTPTACEVDGTTSPTTFRNHGAYVKAGGDPKDPCGKPLTSQQRSNEGQGDEQRSECAPPWAGEGKPTAEQKAQWKANRPASCAADEAGEPEGPPADPGTQGQNPATPPGQEGKDGAGKPAGVGGDAAQPDPTLPPQAADRADDRGPAPTTTTTSTTTTSTTTTTVPA